MSGGTERAGDNGPERLGLLARVRAWLRGGRDGAVAAGRQIICCHCKRRAPRSDFNHAYCATCEDAIRRAYENRDLCPRCGAVGEQRGTVRWTGVDGHSGGAHEEAFCRACQKWYVIPRLGRPKPP